MVLLHLPQQSIPTSALRCQSCLNPIKQDIAYPIAENSFRGWFLAEDSSRLLKLTPCPSWAEGTALLPLCLTAPASVSPSVRRGVGKILLDELGGFQNCRQAVDTLAAWQAFVKQAELHG